MEHRAAVALFKARHKRQIVDDARRQQEKERLFLLTVSERHSEPAVGSARAGDTDPAKLHAVRRELTAAKIDERHRRDAVAREIAVQRARLAVARLREIADEHTPAAASEHQRRAQAGRTPADDDDVEHRSLLSTEAVARRSPSLEGPRVSLM